MFDFATFGNCVRDLRLGKGLTHEQIHKKVGIHAVTLSRIENAKQGCTVYTLAQIAEALECDLEINFVERK